MPEVEHLLRIQNDLGEGPLWDHRQETLWWVDIERSHLFSYDPATSEQRTFQSPTPITVLGLHEGGGFVTAGQKGFGFWDDATETLDLLVDPERDLPNTRFNDGAVDPMGSFWAGTMNPSDSGKPANGLYRLNRDASVTRILDDVTVANGIGWSPDRRTMYFTDTRKRTIFVFDYDANTGSVSNRRPFVSFSPAEGVPDGLCVDADGCIWSALWGGAKIIRFNPDAERQLDISVPASQVTSCAFGGEALDELFITTARTGLSAQERARQPLAGDLFRYRPGVQGQPEYTCRVARLP